MLTSCFKSTREAGPSPHRRRVTGIVDAADRDSSEFVGRDTFLLYQTHGAVSLTAFLRHITDTTMVPVVGAPQLQSNPSYHAILFF